LFVKLGIIGAGTVGNGHAESIAHLDDVIVRAVSDPNPNAAEELTKRWAPSASILSQNELLESSDIDAVIISNPTIFHFQHAKKAIECGKHVYIEIPMVRHLHEGEALVELVKQSDRIVTVGHSLRFWGEYQTIKQKFDSGSVGKPVTIRMGRRTPHPQRWYSNFDSSGSVILDAMVHEFDYIRWCFGPVNRVFCKSLLGRMNTEKLDYALALLRLESGAIAHIESSWCHYGQFCQDVEITGDQGVIQFDNQYTNPILISFIDTKSASRHYFAESPVIQSGHYKLVKGFIEAIVANAPNPVTVEEGLQAVRLAHTAIESIKKKQPVQVSEMLKENRPSIGGRS
jgi:UDP-N-acetylglucosamine 3-dehydrogenase